MTFEIPFNSVIAAEQHELLLKLTYQKNLKRSTYSLALSIVTLLLTWPMVSDKVVMGYFSLAAGGYLFLSSVNYFWFYKKRAAKFRKEYMRWNDEREKSKNISTWEFEDDHFGYKDLLIEYRIKWKAIKGYKIISRNLLLQMTSSVGHVFIIGEKEIGAIGYKSMLELVRSRTNYIKD
jgi:hypothetical protein